MLTTREGCWPDDENPSERYLYVSGEDFSTRFVIFEDKVTAEADIIFDTEEELEQWVEILRLAWRIKAKQDEKGWRPKD